MISCVTALLIALSFPAWHNLGICLGFAEDVVDFESLSVTLAMAKPSLLQGTGVGAIILFMGCRDLVRWPLANVGGLKLALALAPVLLAILLGSMVASPWALSVFLGTLAVSLIVVELLTIR